MGKSPSGEAIPPGRGDKAVAMEAPLVVDLDGTLLRSDLLVETGLLFARDHPRQLLSPFRWLARGRAALKHELARRADLDVAALPYDENVIAFIREARAGGRRVTLATASHQTLAGRIADHLGLFDEVLASRPDVNLKGEVKRDALLERYGEQGFDYLGNAGDDLPVWRAARKTLVANAAARLERKARALGNFAGVVSSRRARFGDWARALRLHQWLKNLLIFVPLLTAHRYLEAPLLLQALLAFFCFGLCASSVYLLNDLLDLRDDRHHARKRHRPFASGRLSPLSGLAVFPVLLLCAFGIATWRLPGAFALGMLAYYGLTLAYSMRLKRLWVVDVVALAALYTLRIIIGAVALGIPLSFWLLAFSVFIFLSLALVKRYAELLPIMRAGGEDGKARGRGYHADDLPMIASLGTASGYMSVIVLALYVNDPVTLEHYRHPEFIWCSCLPLLIWISRVWFLAHRGQMHEDPVVFAVSDRVSLAIVALMGLAFWVAI
ncbi:MAG: UbiA family prenyltransferase [Azoarcus sp.]|jgi:4-hydroxybenzoate polyprenyltransferase/phosphoserine phosphatase|nr:UbiA family prenyltransferase [Azoarcus sp.]